MSSTVLRCPACGAPDGSPDDGQGLHRCEHCGSRYRWRPGAPRGQLLSTSPRRTRRVVVALLAGGALVAGLGWLYLSSREPQAPVRATVLEAGSPSPEATVPPVMSESLPAPPPPPPPSARLTVHGTVQGYQDSFYVLAEVTNTSPYTLRRPHLTVVLRDEEGQELFQADGYAALDTLAPGQTSPVKVLVKDPPDHASFDVEMALQAASFVPPMAGDLEVESLPPSVDGQGSYRVSGKVVNRGQAPARFVEVILLARDAQGGLIDLRSTYAAGREALAPGEAGRFTFSNLRYPRPPASWDFVVTGRVAD